MALATVCAGARVRMAPARAAPPNAQLRCGACTTNMGCGIVAGCNRPQSLARAYAHQAMDNTRNEATPSGMEDPTGQSLEGSSFHQHVDDLTQPVWTTGRKRLGNIAVKAAIK